MHVWVEKQNVKHVLTLCPERERKVDEICWYFSFCFLKTCTGKIHSLSHDNFPSAHFQSLYSSSRSFLEPGILHPRLHCSLAHFFWWVLPINRSRRLALWGNGCAIANPYGKADKDERPSHHTEMIGVRHVYTWYRQAIGLLLLRGWIAVWQ